MKYWNYLKYILRHKWYVMWECFRHGLYWQGLVHDLSKFRPSEFFPYANFFYEEHRCERGLNTRPLHIDYAFDLAWLKHLHRNPHHWQHWIRNGDDGTIRIFEMPRKYWLEMVADWVGAGIVITGQREVQKWYLKNRDKISLHIKTRLTVETLLELEKYQNVLQHRG
jgi:hypothetical protein